MKRLKKTTLVVMLLVVVALCLSYNASAATYDLKTDWKIGPGDNPNGPWAFYQGSTLLPYQPDYDSTHGYVIGQQAWAVGTYPNYDHVPVWMQATKDGEWGADVKTGDIMMHPANLAVYPNVGQGSVTWTSNLTGTVSISGNAWWGDSTGVLFGTSRGDSWSLSLDGKQLTSGNVDLASGYSRINPDSFGTFTESVKPGDVIQFIATSEGSLLPWMMGVNLNIDATPVPVPGALLLFGPGLLGLASLRRRFGK